jgi:predicted nuclease of predicted toxin-antitoxin system
VRILANENVQGEIVQSLRAQGHDIVWIRIDAPGSADSEVLAMAQTEKPIVMTFDKDFGELAFVGAFQQQAGSFSFV